MRLATNSAPIIDIEGNLQETCKRLEDLSFFLHIPSGSDGILVMDLVVSCCVLLLLSFYWAN